MKKNINFIYKLSFSLGIILSSYSCNEAALLRACMEVGANAVRGVAPMRVYAVRNSSSASTNLPVLAALGLYDMSSNLTCEECAEAYKTGQSIGRHIGRAEKAIETAVNMISLGYKNPTDIALITGVALEEIMALLDTKAAADK